MIKIYRKTATIKAEQFDYEKWVHMRHDAYPMVFGDTAKDGGMMATNPVIPTLEGDMKVHDGDWIATGANDEHWPIADDVFRKTYAELPVIPKYVDEYIRLMKSLGKSVGGAIKYWLREDEIDEYMEDNSEKFARAWLDGYQVEADK